MNSSIPSTYGENGGGTEYMIELQGWSPAARWSSVISAWIVIAEDRMAASALLAFRDHDGAVIAEVRLVTGAPLIFREHDGPVITEHRLAHHPLDSP